MRRAVYACPLVALAIAACSRAPTPPPAPPVTVRLSIESPDGNAPAVAAFFRRTCLDASGDLGAFERALQTSGWEVERTQVASASNPVNGWQVDRGQLYHSVAEGGRGLRLIDCHLALEGPVAPGVERMRAALRPLIRHASLGSLPNRPNEVGWRWQPSPGEERTLTVGLVEAGTGAAPGRRGIAIHFASTPLMAQAPPPGEGR